MQRDGPLGTWSDDPGVFTCAPVEAGDLFVEGATVLRNVGRQPAHIVEVQLQHPDGVELIDLYRYSPEGNGWNLVGLVPGTALDYPLLPTADRRHVLFDGTWVEPGEEIALILQLRLTADRATFDRVVVDYVVDGEAYEFRGNFRYEVRREWCS